MGYIAKLIYGALEFNLNDDTYSLALTFVPPTVQLAPSVASGTSSNRAAGGKVVGVSALDRAWTLPVRIRGGSAAETHQAANRLKAFLDLSLDDSYTLYFAYREDNSYNFEPLWGQFGAYKRYRIKINPNIPIDARYNAGTINNRVVLLVAELLLTPYAEGTLQRAGSATGWILENIAGTAGGRSRGVTIGRAHINRMTNPVFGHATWNNGWTAGTSILAQKNTDPRYYLFGNVSAKITRSGVVSGFTFTQSINVGSTNTQWLSCYARLPDKSAITSTIMQLYYGADVTTTYQAVGNGWYLLYAEVTGVAALTDTGVTVKQNSRTVYLDGFTIHTSAFYLGFGYGDMLGWVWDGTAHASTSTATVGRIRVSRDDIANMGQGTIRIVWRPDNPNTELTGDIYLFQADPTTSLSFRWVQASNVWRLSDGVNSASSAATSFSAFTTIIFHLTWGPAGMVIYRNGTSIGTEATFAPPGAGNDLYIGSDRTVANHCGGIFLGFASFDAVMSAAEVTADYNNIIEHISGGDGFGQRLETIPYLWTDDGDDIVDNVSDADQENWCVVGGVPGNVEAEGLWKLTLSASLSTVKTLGLSRFDVPENLHFDWVDFNYEDKQGTVPGTPANFSGGEYGLNAWAASTGGTDAPWSAGKEVIRQDVMRAMLDREWCMVAKVSEVDNDLLIAVKFTQTSDGSVLGDYRTITTATTFYMVHSGFVYLRSPRSDPVLDALSYSGLWAGSIKVLSGTSTSDVDFQMSVPRPIVIFGDKDTTSGATVIVYDGEKANLSDGSSNFRGKTTVRGDRLEFLPNRKNILIAMISLEGQVDPIATRTLTYSALYLKPRWAIL